MTSDERLQKLQLKAEKHLQSGEIEKAGELLLEILETGPAFPYGLYQLGLYYFNQGNDDEALKRLESALEMSPEMISARFLKGRILHERKLYREALAQFRECVKLDRKDDEAYFSMAKACFELGLPDEALAFLLEASSIDPENIAYREAIAAFYLQKNDAAKAWEYLSGDDLDMIERPEALVLLTKVANKLGNRVTQLNAMEKLVAVNPEVKEEVWEKITKLKKDLGL